MMARIAYGILPLAASAPAQHQPALGLCKVWGRVVHGRSSGACQAGSQLGQAQLHGTLRTWSQLGGVPALVALGQVVHPQRAVHDLKPEHLPKALPVPPGHLLHHVLHSSPYVPAARLARSCSQAGRAPWPTAPPHARLTGGCGQARSAPHSQLPVRAGHQPTKPPCATASRLLHALP